MRGLLLVLALVRTCSPCPSTYPYLNLQVGCSPPDAPLHARMGQRMHPVPILTPVIGKYVAARQKAWERVPQNT